jgi:ubiquinone/menaquinone biosynthesis C-methylase UbiE
MNESAEKRISNFYNTEGWKELNGITEDAIRFEDLREFSKEYVSKCRLRLLNFIPQNGEHFLDMASGPIQYKEYLKYSEGFSKRLCVDLSFDALKVAQNKIGSHGEFHHGSFFDLEFESNYFDCSISVHTIYHMDKDMQSIAVRKLIDVTKKDCPIIIVYSNPKSIINKFSNSFIVKFIRKIKTQIPDTTPSKTSLYFHAHDLNWWNQFKPYADVKIYPWRSFDSDYQKRLFPDNIIGKTMLKILFFLEDFFPKFFTKYLQYPMIVLIKN